MKKSNTAFATFLDSKYIPLEQKTKILIAVFILLLPAILFFFLFFQPNQKTIVALNSQKDGLATEVQNVKEKARNLPLLEKELAETERVFNEKATLLPRDKEIPKLLKDISGLGMNAGLDFLSFKPLPDVPQDFYSEIPISINVRGPYHSMGAFFDQVSKLNRIVSVNNIAMTAPTKEGGEMLLNSSCQLVTYRFTNIERPKPEEKK
jgi:type IV pilus assembly protein PilO